MGVPASHVDSILEALQERAKELDCLYKVNEICSRVDASTDQILRDIVDVIPTGWMYPDDCGTQITVQGVVRGQRGPPPTRWIQRSPIRIQGEVVGSLEVFYRKERPAADEGPFLRQERKLIDALAERIGQLLLNRWDLSPAPSREGGEVPLAGPGGDLPLIVDSLLKTDHDLLVQIVRRMINYLAWNGCADAQDLLPRITGGGNLTNRHGPLEREGIDALMSVAEETFRIASSHLSTPEILTLIQKWIQDDRSSFLIEAVENQGTSMTEIARALERFSRTAVDDHELSRTVQVALRVSLARRFLTDDLDFIDTAKSYVSAGDYCELARRVVFLPKSHGRIGGKGSGLLLASKIVERSGEYADALRGIKVPKTWYILSDGVLDFIEHNHIKDLYDRKYLEIEKVRREYPHIIQVFKNSTFSPEIVKGISLALDDLEDRPLVVRSSSLLEDRAGPAFTGKYKTLFLANQGAKRERLTALLDAIAEVYASIFGPDPIAYRAERGLLDVHEEMGILIQEVVGNRVGPWFFPTFAGVALSSNELRWSEEVTRDDGLARLVPGLGTRAVDRVEDGSPVLMAAGRPGLRPRSATGDPARKIDAVNLETGRLETLDLEAVLRDHASSIPGIENVVSLRDGHTLRRPTPQDLAGSVRDLTVTFDGLVEGTPFLPRLRALLRLLRERTGGPVGIELASDGRDLYLLECRPQSLSDEPVPAPLPEGVPSERTVFVADRYVSNGGVLDTTHVVYVDPEAFLAAPGAAERVGRAVGRLNRVLPKRQFVLMGPGPWGIRGAGRGVPVTYSAISNAACLVEMCRDQAGSLPDIPVGTHFLEDLVGSSIGFVQVFTGDGGGFNERFLKGSPSIFLDLLPDLGDLAPTIRVIDVPRSAGGLVLRLVMNAGLDRAVGYLASPDDGADAVADGETETRRPARSAPNDRDISDL